MKRWSMKNKHNFRFQFSISKRYVIIIIAAADVINQLNKILFKLLKYVATV